MERDEFSYIGGGVNDSVLGGGVAPYIGLIQGLRSDGFLRSHYMGLSDVISLGADIPLGGIFGLGIGTTMSNSISDRKLFSINLYLGISASKGIPFVDGGVGLVNYKEEGDYRLYQPGEFGSMLSDMVTGRYSPIQGNVNILYQARGVAAVIAARYYYIYMEMRNEQKRADAFTN